MPVAAVLFTMAAAAWLLLGDLTPPREAPGDGKPTRKIEAQPLPRQSEVRRRESSVRLIQPGDVPPLKRSTSDASRTDADEPSDVGPEEIEAGVYIEALREAGETGGLAAFPPPGSKPPRTGVLVPEDYVLPEGYARHFQTADDGRALAAILIVSPGYEIVDGQGAPVALEDGRIVPPEFAPADLPIEMLDVPAESSAADVGE